MDVSTLSAGELGVISGCFLFRGLPEDTVSRTLGDGSCSLRSFQKGDIIYDIRSYRREISIILSGTVEVSRQTEERRFVMNTLSPGGIFGAAAVFNEEDDYVTTLTAQSACRLIFLPQELLRALMRESFEAAENYIAFLSGRIRFLNGKIGGLVLPDAAHTLAGYLLSAVRRGGGAAEGTVELTVSLSTLASMLNMGRASLYRAFDELEAAGIIAKNGKKITVIDRNKLEGYMK